MKHTKGKWVIRKIGNIRYEVNSQDRYIAECPIPFAHQDYEVEEAEANAKLIAAAPDLLVVCEQVLAWASADTEEGGDFAYFSEHIWQRLEDTVKEAKGE